MGLKAFIEKIEPDFDAGGKYEKFYALYEAAATISIPRVKSTKPILMLKIAST
jgi:Na+-transporting NADH:ubiquinone oxidoreductase subunit NqrB